MGITEQARGEHGDRDGVAVVGAGAAGVEPIEKRSHGIHRCFQTLVGPVELQPRQSTATNERFEPLIDTPVRGDRVRIHRRHNRRPPELLLRTLGFEVTQGTTQRFEHLHQTGLRSTRAQHLVELGEADVHLVLRRASPTEHAADGDHFVVGETGQLHRATHQRAGPLLETRSHRAPQHRQLRTVEVADRVDVHVGALLHWMRCANTPGVGGLRLRS